MPENNKNLNLSRQKRALLLLEWSTGFHPAGSVWVLLLGLRAFSLVEIGLVESLFHVVSLWGELPSGLLADLLGRRRTLLLSQAMFVLCALLMAASGGMAGVCIAMAANALAYNLQSGTREAITYESMLQAGREEGYLGFSSLQNGLFRLSDGGAMLLAGATVLLGWRTAYLLDAAVAALGLCGALALTEPERPRAQPRAPSFPAALAEVFRAAWAVLRQDRIARRIMALNALVGAGATLTRFFLQQRVGEAVTIPALLGPALFVLGLGGALAGLITGPLDRLPYGRAVLLTGAGVAACVLLARGHFLPVLMAAGLLSGLLDDALQLVSDKRLNTRYPSSARATLVSVSSMVFSLTMIPLAPLFGWLFS